MESIIYKVVNGGKYKLFKNSEVLLESDKQIFIAIYLADGRYIGLTNYFVTTKYRVKNEILTENTLELYIEPV